MTSYQENFLYTRELLNQPVSFVKNGKPVFGTFAGHPQRLDIRGVSGPYSGLPIPTLLTNLRIKSRLSFYFSIGKYLGQISFYDAKIFGFAEVTFWDTDSNQKFVYRNLMGPRKRFVPHKLETASTSSYRKSRYIRISWDRKINRLSVIFNLKGDSVRPSANAALIADFSNSSFAELTNIVPSPTMRKCSAKYNACIPLHGALTLIPKNSKPLTMNDCNGICFFDMNRTYMKFKSYGSFITAMGTINGKMAAFRIESTSQEAVNPDKYNGNVLFYDGTVTPLSPVVITCPQGIHHKWIIQDTENMIDLTFNPVSDNISKISVFVLRAVYHTIYGNFEGTLLTSSGEKLSFKSLPGISQKYTIRL